jgi:hypothetical protein
VLSVAGNIDGGVFALAFSADSVTELTLNGSQDNVWQVGDGPGYAVHVTNRLPGDINEDLVHDVIDVVSIVNIAFRGAASPVRPGSADVNADCAYDILDVVLIVNQAFRGGANLYWGCAQ